MKILKLPLQTFAFCVLVLFFTAFIQLSVHVVQAAAAAPAEPFVFTSSDHDYIVDKNNNVYYAVGYYCTQQDTPPTKEPVFLSQASKMRILDEQSGVGLISQPKSGDTCTDVKDGTTGHANFAWATANVDGSPNYVITWLRGETSAGPPYSSFNNFDHKTGGSYLDDGNLIVYRMGSGANSYLLGGNAISSIKVDKSKQSLVDADKEKQDKALKDKCATDPTAMGCIAEPTADTGTENNDADGDGIPDDEEVDSCNTNILNWLVCPVIDMTFKTINQLDKIINQLLTVDTNKVFSTDAGSTASKEDKDSSTAYYKAWSNFRNFAYGILIIIGLVIVISSALGLEFLDAYTIRRALPRLFIAGILIALSWGLAQFLVTLSNDVGNGVRALIYAPFKGFQQVQLGFVDQTLLFAVMAAAAALYGFAILSFGLTALLGIIIALLVLVVREMIVIFLIIIAPVALIMFILPNTNKFWDLWQKTFVSMLLVFPIIAGFIALGRVFSAVAFQNGNADTIGTMIAFVAYFLPYFMIPFAFRMAGGLMATIAGISNDRSRGMFDRLSKGRQQSMHNRWGKGGTQREPIERRALQRRADVNKRLQDWGSSSRGNFATRGLARAGGRIVGGHNMEAAMSARRAQAIKEVQDQVSTGDDSEVRGLTAYGNVFTDTDGVRKYNTLGGAKVSEAAVLRARSRWGHDTFAQQAALSYEMGKATSGEEVQSVLDHYGEVSKGWGHSDKQRKDVWIGSAFANQNHHLEFKRMKYNEGTGHMELQGQGTTDFVKEIYEKRGSYNMAQMNAHTIQALETAYATADEPTKRQIEGIAETFVHRYGAGAGGYQNIPEDGQPVTIPQQPPGQQQQVQDAKTFTLNTPGAAHTAEAVFNLANTTGVYQNRDPEPQSGNALPPNPPQQ